MAKPQDGLTVEQYRDAATRLLARHKTLQMIVPPYGSVHRVADGGAYVEVSLFVSADDVKPDPIRHWLSTH